MYLRLTLWSNIKFPEMFGILHQYENNNSKGLIMQIKISEDKCSHKNNMFITSLLKKVNLLLLEIDHMYYTI